MDSSMNQMDLSMDSMISSISSMDSSISSMESSSYEEEMMSWSAEADKALMQLWKDNECLYNSKHELFSNIDARKAAVQNISTKMEELILKIAPENLLKKMECLRIQFSKELDGINDRLNRTAAGAACCVDDLNFLKDFVVAPKNESSLLAKFGCDVTPPMSQDGSSPEEQLSEGPSCSKKNLNLDFSAENEVIRRAQNILDSFANSDNNNRYINTFIKFLQESMHHIKNKEDLFESLMLVVHDFMRKERPENADIEPNKQ